MLALKNKADMLTPDQVKLALFIAISSYKQELFLVGDLTGNEYHHAQKRAHKNLWQSVKNLWMMSIRENTNIDADVRRRMLAQIKKIYTYPTNVIFKFEELLDLIDTDEN